MPEKESRSKCNVISDGIRYLKDYAEVSFGTLNGALHIWDCGICK